MVKLSVCCLAGEYLHGDDKQDNDRKKEKLFVTMKGKRQPTIIFLCHFSPVLSHCIFFIKVNECVTRHHKGDNDK